MTDELRNGQHQIDFDGTSINRRRLIFLDTETTGMNFYSDRICEIAAVEIDENFNEVGVFHSYINPQMKMPWYVQKIHGLSDRFLKDKPIFSEVARDLLLFLEGAELYAHNMPFDSGFINAELQRAKLPNLIKCDCSLHCTVRMARSLYPGQKASLDALCQRFGVDLSARSLHGALLDTRLLIEVYKKMVNG